MACNRLIIKKNSAPGVTREHANVGDGVQTLVWQVTRELGFDV
jgi:hypothetical protein